jgi:hypothetical protein
MSISESSQYSNVSYVFYMQGEGELEAAILDVTERVQTAESEVATARQHASAFEVIYM